MSPRGVPTLGSGVSLPSGEVLGVVKEKILDEKPSTNAWSNDDVTVTMTDPPPPWELTGGDQAVSDARRYVDVPVTWALRWINPKVLDQFGWRYWQPVMKSDPRVKVKVATMVSPEGNIRRGGHTGDILAWMYQSWVDARRASHQRDTERQSKSSIENQQRLKEDFARGKYGPSLALDSVSHPHQTIADGLEMRSRQD